jgi:hypothetical protein
MEHATDFYKQLFGPVVDFGVRLNDSIWDENEKLDENDRNILNAPFTEEEIHQAISQMEKNKAAGPDGIPIEFYQHCWCVVKNDMMRMFNDFHNQQIIWKESIMGLSHLFPKVMMLKLFRSIDQYVCYKFYSKYSQKL